METTDFRKHALVPKSKGARRNTRMPPIDPGLMPFILGKLAPEDRRALAYIVEYGDFLEAEGRRFLLVPMVQKIEETLATFQAEAADLEPEHAGCEAEDDLPGPRHAPGNEADAEDDADEERPGYNRTIDVRARRERIRPGLTPGGHIDWLRERNERVQAAAFVAAAKDRKPGERRRLNR